jgi:dTDP-4-amino-4,6-dideoxygalactose transaminase
MYSHRALITDADIRSVVECLSDPTVFGTGKLITKLEEMMCEMTGYRHCIVMNCASAALNLAVKAIKIQTNHGPFIEDNYFGIVPKNTYIASARCFVRAGINVETYDCPKEVAGIMEEKKWGIGMAVHYAGARIDMNHFSSCSFIIEDATHALSSKMKAYKSPETDAVVYSFNATKNVTGGQGGCLLTDDEGLADIVRNLRHFNMNECFIPEYVIKYGGNYKLADINAALIISQLQSLQIREDETRQLVSRYEISLEHTNLTYGIDEDFWAIDEHTSQADYPHLINLRFKEPLNVNPLTIVDRLRNLGVYTNVYYPDVTHLLAGRGQCYVSKTEYVTLPLDRSLSVESCHNILGVVYGIIAKYQ